MKFVLATLASLLLLVGCNDGPKADPIVKVISQCGNDNISVSDIKGRKKSDGFMKAQVTGYNSSSDYELLEYRIVWLDRDGFKIDSILSKWKTSPANAKQPFFINGISPNTKAKSFRIYIRKNEEIICNKQSN